MSQERSLLLSRILTSFLLSDKAESGSIQLGNRGQAKLVLEEDCFVVVKTEQGRELNLGELNDYYLVEFSKLVEESYLPKVVVENLVTAAFKELEVDSTDWLKVRDRCFKLVADTIDKGNVRVHNKAYDPEVDFHLATISHLHLVITLKQLTASKPRSFRQLSTNAMGKDGTTIVLKHSIRTKKQIAEIVSCFLSTKTAYSEVLSVPKLGSVRLEHTALEGTDIKLSDIDLKHPRKLESLSEEEINALHHTVTIAMGKEPKEATAIEYRLLPPAHGRCVTYPELEQDLIPEMWAVAKGRKILAYCLEEKDAIALKSYNDSQDKIVIG